ncbi:MAG: response regulator transcription factor [Halieaceae bacterium]|jgi:DNA-binding NarL/FixJ family response regulator|nr:response regulator transcription factor [Halieaceae bacterium]
MGPTRVVIADDHAIVRKGLHEMLGALAEIELVAEAANGIETIAAVKRHRPDLLMLDIAMPYASGLELIEEIRSWSPETRIAVFTGVQTSGVMAELIDANVEGLLLKSSPPDEISLGLTTLLKQQRFISEEAQSLARESREISGLTSRERQVLHQIVAGNSNADIARVLNISPKTAENHRTNLMRKLDVHSLGSLIQVALRAGLLTAEPGVDKEA